MKVKEQSINPHKHWRNLLIAFSVVIFALILWSIYLLYSIKNDQIFHNDTVPAVSVSQLKQNSLDTVTKSFDDKSKKENDLMTNPPVFPDPSL